MRILISLFSLPSIKCNLPYHRVLARVLFRTLIDLKKKKKAREVCFHLVQLAELCRLSLDLVGPFPGHPGAEGVF